MFWKAQHLLPGNKLEPAYLMVNKMEPFSFLSVSLCLVFPTFLCNPFLSPLQPLSTLSSTLGAQRTALTGCIWYFFLYFGICCTLKLHHLTFLQPSLFSVIFFPSTLPWSVCDLEKSNGDCHHLRVMPFWGRPCSRRRAIEAIMLKALPNHCTSTPQNPPTPGM